MELMGVFGAVALLIIVYNREDRIERFFFSHKVMRQITPLIVCFLIAFLFAVKLVLSPFNATNIGTDSSVFLYIGKSMHRGSIPYKDLFDHKGIILYFIEYLGLSIGFGHLVGVWIVELINLFVTVFIFFSIANLFSSSRAVCYTVVFIVFSLSVSGVFEGGNLVEEFALPWISLSLYIVIRFFLTKTYKKWQIILLGFSFSIVFFLRVNMAGIWGILLLAVMIYLVKSKRTTEIFKCALLFTLGTLIVLVPVLIYLLSTDSLKSMIEYYFIFNISYTGSFSEDWTEKFFYMWLSYAGISAFFIAYTVCVYFRSKIVILHNVTLIFAYFLATMSGRPYPHYFMILIPFFIIPAVLTVGPFMEKTKAMSIPIKKKSLTALAILLCVYLVASPTASYIRDNIKTPNSYLPLNAYLDKNTTESDDVLILGNYARFYINSNRYTANKFFYQRPIDISDALYKEFISEFKKAPSDYIFCLRQDFIENTDQNSSSLSNMQKVVAYLNQECEKGIYRLETGDDFFVYVRK